MRTIGRAPATWGSRIPYDSTNWQPWQPAQWVIHWNGGPVRVDDQADEEAYLQMVERFHIETRGWMGIAYNYAIGAATGTLYRCRGEQRSGAQWSEANPISRAVLLTLGSGQFPNLWARRTFAVAYLEDPLPVKPHRQVNDEGGDPPTSCPGDTIAAWVAAGRWAEDFGYVGVGATGRRVVAVRRTLKRLGYVKTLGGVNRNRYTRWLARIVTEYQTNQELTTDGIFGPQTYRSASDMPPKPAQPWGEEQDTGWETMYAFDV